MAPRRQLVSLYQLSFKAVTQLVDKGLHSTLMNHGSFGSTKCTSDIEAIQKQLVTFLPLSVIEELAEERILNRNYWGPKGMFELNVYAILHPSITRLHGKTERHTYVGWWKKAEYTNFWLSQLGKMNNLVSLSLNCSTDEILIVVGQSCPNLEKFTMVTCKQSAWYTYTEGMREVSIWLSLLWYI